MTLLSEYGFNEGTGATAADSSGNSRQLTATNSTSAWSASGRVKSGATGASSAGFFGAVGPSASLTDFTVMAWVYISSNPSGHYQIISSHSQNFWFEIGGSGGTRHLDVFLNVSNVISTGEIALNTWTHVAVVASSGGGGTVGLYINASLDGSGSGGQFATKDFGQVCNVGYADNAGVPYDYIDGVVDDLRVFDAALTQNEILLHMGTPVGKAVLDVLSGPSGTANTWFGLDDHIGKRVIVLVADRSGGQTASVTASNGTWNFTQVASRVTSPLDSSLRRSVFLFETVVPPDASGNPIISVEVLDGGAVAVGHTWIAALINGPDTYNLAAVASADSGGSTTLSQITGTTSSVPAGDLLVISAASMRGDAVVDWSTTSDNPPRPGGGTWDLNVADTNSNLANRRRGSMGYAELPAQSVQSWDDVITLDTARMTSAVIAVWSTGATGPATAEFEGWGVPLF